MEQFLMSVWLGIVIIAMVVVLIQLAITILRDPMFYDIIPFSLLRKKERGRTDAINTK